MISVLGSFTGITQHTGPTALRPIRRTKQLWLSVLLKDTGAATGLAGIRTHILTTPMNKTARPRHCGCFGHSKSLIYVSTEHGKSGFPLAFFHSYFGRQIGCYRVVFGNFWKKQRPFQHRVCLMGNRCSGWKVTQLNRFQRQENTSRSLFFGIRQFPNVMYLYYPWRWSFCATTFETIAIFFWAIKIRRVTACLRYIISTGSGLGTWPIYSNAEMVLRLHIFHGNFVTLIHQS